jgi:signal transduction histidine kinase
MRMIPALFNWRSLLSIIAIGIFSGSIIFSNYLSRKLAREETAKVEQWVEANKVMASTNETHALSLATDISSRNDDIPIIATDERDSIIDTRNLDSARILQNHGYLRQELTNFKALHAPIIWEQSTTPYIYNKVYYGESMLLKEIRYYPIVQLCVIALFIIITITAINTRYKSDQNQIWAGMAKETAHQLGTPVSSLEAWVELLKEGQDDGGPGNMETILPELEKDVARLRLVSDRFGKIGSTPQLEERDMVGQVQQMIGYMRKRASSAVQFVVNTHGELPVMVNLSPPLFDWVMENLLKNALDAMEGKGLIVVDIYNHALDVTIDVTDSGKGILGKNIRKVFKPGFTTKKRGWGLGLSLSKRIIEQYHNGALGIKWSEHGKGTAFRIILKKLPA